MLRLHACAFWPSTDDVLRSDHASVWLPEDHRVPQCASRRGIPATACDPLAGRRRIPKADRIAMQRRRRQIPRASSPCYGIAADRRSHWSIERRSSLLLYSGMVQTPATELREGVYCTVTQRARCAGRPCVRIVNVPPSRRLSRAYGAHQRSTLSALGTSRHGPAE
ncbi:hypothetical protein BD310DRAFT_317593 [Dichomitus squalens]|uniref:Uncharacterized protein n=1 Tax=Dichomitus squalens TaxID=114155 RepID=A0A4Q9PAK9_9APHY|nr:hypothetical protein BD310DRAFT_317593 [Dichomitus squalens]